MKNKSISSSEVFELDRTMVASAYSYPLHDDYTLHMFDDITTIAEQWDTFTNEKLLFTSKYHNTIQSAVPSMLIPAYGLIYKGKELFGAIDIQLKRNNLYESLSKKEKSKTFVGFINGCFRKLIARRVQGNYIVIGNILLTGDYSIRTSAHQDKNLQAHLITESISKANQYFKEKYKKSSIAYMIKDLESMRCIDQIYADANFSKVFVEPCMMVDIPEDWNTFDDYMACIKSKYKVRIKRAIKKAVDITSKELSLADIKEHQVSIKTLYDQIALSAGFNLFELPNDYFYQLKNHLGEQCLITGYFLNEKLIAFSSLIYESGKEADAHFLGYDKSINGQYHIYHNMLIDLLKDSIRLNIRSLNLSRTALEIKSSMGAKPVQYPIYVKMSNGIFNKILAWAFEKFKPNNQWQERNPFK